jgi:hypothetical protein
MIEQFEQLTDAIAVDVGSETDLYGRTRVVLGRDAGVVETFRDGKHDSVRVELGATDAADIFETASQLRQRSEARAPRRPLPDEPRYRISVRLRGAVVFEGERWRSELEADPILSRVLARLQAIAYERTDGRALL